MDVSLWSSFYRKKCSSCLSSVRFLCQECLLEKRKETWCGTHSHLQGQILAWAPWMFWTRVFSVSMWGSTQWIWKPHSRLFSRWRELRVCLLWTRVHGEERSVLGRNKICFSILWIQVRINWLSSILQRSFFKTGKHSNCRSRNTSWRKECSLTDDQQGCQPGVC